MAYPAVLLICPQMTDQLMQLPSEKNKKKW